MIIIQEDIPQGHFVKILDESAYDFVNLLGISYPNFLEFAPDGIAKKDLLFNEVLSQDDIERKNLYEMEYLFIQLLKHAAEREETRRNG